MKDSSRKEALCAFIDIVEEGAYANLRLQELPKTEQRSFAYAWVYASLEHISWADYMLAHYVKRQKRTVRNLLRMAVTELFFMDTPAYAAVNEAVALCRELGKKDSAALVNGVLRRMLQDKDALPPLPQEPALRLSIEHSLPLFALKEWIGRYGLDTAKAMLERSTPLTELRAQYPYTTEALLAQYPAAQRGRSVPDCILLPGGVLTPQSPLFTQGKISFQGEGAMAICRFMGDMRGKRVLDACAAPGGKSAYLYSLTQGDIELSCMELHPHRVELLHKTFERLSVQARVYEQDASLPLPKLEEAFDGVLLDVPCSGLGLLHSKPDVGLHKTEESITALTRIQGQILKGCCGYVRPGGVLVYASCTVAYRENEGQVKGFLAAHPDFVLEEEKQLLPNIDTKGGFYMARMRRCI